MQSYYDLDAVRPMEQELERVGVTPLKTAAEVDEAIKTEGTTLVIVNSICGCAAGNARPGAMLGLQYSKIPHRITTVFAGVDHEAVNQARSHMTEIAPSSPSIALFKDGTLVFALERRHIEQMTADHIADVLTKAFEHHCTKPGPSIPAEEFQKINPLKQCGSSIPLNSQSVTGP